MTTIPADFQALLVHEPFRRTLEGARVAGREALDLSEDSMSVLLQVNGETPFDLLLGAHDSVLGMYEAIWTLYQRGLVAPASSFPA